MQKEEFKGFDEDLRDLILDYYEMEIDANKVLLACEIYKMALRNDRDHVPDSVVTLLIDAFQRAEFTYERVLILRAMESGPPDERFESLFIECLNDKDPKVQIAAFHNLMAFGEVDHQDYLPRFLEDIVRSIDYGILSVLRFNEVNEVFHKVFEPALEHVEKVQDPDYIPPLRLVGAISLPIPGILLFSLSLFVILFSIIPVLFEPNGIVAGILVTVYWFTFVTVLIYDKMNDYHEMKIIKQLAKDLIIQLDYSNQT